MHVGETKVAAMESIGELFMIESKKVQYRGLEVVDMDLAFDDTKAEVIGLAEDGAGLHPAAGQLHGEGTESEGGSCWSQMFRRRDRVSVRREFPSRHEAVLACHTGWEGWRRMRPIQ